MNIVDKESNKAMTNRQHEIILRQETPVHKEDEISLKELLFTIIRGKKIILLTALIVLLAVTVVSMALPYIERLNSRGAVQTAMQLYFPSIKDGNAPSGGKYNPSEIKSVEVLQAAVTDANLQNRGISLALLQNNISFEALLSAESQAALNRINALENEELKLQQLEGLSLNPDAYILTLHVANGLNISLDEARRLSDAIVYAYKDWLIATYGAQAELANVFDSGLKLEEYDYIQTADILNTQLTSMENYVNLRGGLNGVSAEQFYEVRDVLDSIRTVELEVLYTKIATHNLTKDSQKAEAIYQQMVEEQTRFADQKAEEAASLMDMITNYRSNQEKILLGGMGGTALNLQTSSAAYDELVLRYTLAKNQEARARAEAEYYRRQGERLAGADSNIQATEEDIRQTVENINTIKEKLVYWTDEINRINNANQRDDMHQKYAEQLVPAGVYRQESSVNLLMNMAIGLAAGLLIGILAVLLKEFLKDDDTEENGDKNRLGGAGGDAI